MIKKIAICPQCSKKIPCEGKKGQTVEVVCSSCGKKGRILFGDLLEIDFYPLNEPFAFVKILKDPESLDQHYRVIEPILREDEEKTLLFIEDMLIKSINVRLDEIEKNRVEKLLVDHIDRIVKDY